MGTFSLLAEIRPFWNFQWSSFRIVYISREHIWGICASFLFCFLVLVFCCLFWDFLGGGLDNRLILKTDRVRIVYLPKNQLTLWTQLGPVL